MTILVTIGFYKHFTIRMLFFGFACLFGLFLWFRFKKGWACLFFSCLTFLSWLPSKDISYPQPGLYRVYEIKNNYSIARNEEGVDVLVTGLKDVSYYDVYQLENFKPIAKIMWVFLILKRICMQKEYIILAMGMEKI